MDKLSEKELEVVKHFISEEGSIRPGYKKIKYDYVPDNSPLNDHYYAYAKKISDDMYHRITRGWASQVCQRLEELGILDHKMIRPPRQKNETEYYFLKSDLSSFKKLIKLLMDNTDDIYKSWWIFQQAYFWKMTSANIIQELLYQKKLILSRSLDIINWDEEEAQQLYKSYYEKFISTYIPGTEDYSRYDPGSSFSEYVTKLIEFKKNNRGYSDKWSPPKITLFLPVFSDNIPIDKRIDEFNRRNKNELSKYPTLSYSSSVVKQHYQEHELEKVILPIQILVRISPNALKYILDNDWLPDQYWFSLDEDGLCHMSYLLYRLLFTAISDQAIIRTIYANDLFDEYANIRDRSNAYNRDRYTPLLSVRLRRGGSMWYDGGFDTEHTFIGTASGDVIEPDQRSNYWAMAWVDYLYKYGYDTPTKDWKYLDILCKHSVSDPGSLIEKIRSSSDPAIIYLRKKFTNKGLNIIKHYLSYGPSDDLVLHTIIDELNRLITTDDLYNEVVFKSVQLSDETLKLINSKKSEEESSYPSILIYIIDELNRRLLDDLFPELVKYERRF